MSMRRETSPIFIVGTSRSGTSMMRDIVARHPDVWIGGETHYFDDLRVRLRGRDCLPLTPDQQRCARTTSSRSSTARTAVGETPIAGSTGSRAESFERPPPVSGPEPTRTSSRSAS